MFFRSTLTPNNFSALRLVQIWAISVTLLLLVLFLIFNFYIFISLVVYIPRVENNSLKYSNQIKSNLFAIVKMHNKQFIKITFHLAGQTGDSYALMSAHKN